LIVGFALYYVLLAIIFSVTAKTCITTIIKVHRRRHIFNMSLPPIITMTLSIAVKLLPIIATILFVDVTLPPVNRKERWRDKLFQVLNQICCYNSSINVLVFINRLIWISHLKTT